MKHLKGARLGESGTDNIGLYRPQEAQGNSVALYPGHG